MDQGLTRRVVLRDGTALTVAVLLAGPASTLGDIAIAVTPGEAAFLTDPELETLRGLVDRFIPGKPEDTDDGAVVAGCAEAIDALLGAFGVDPPLIYAGAPFSDRGGSTVNHFEDFLRLDSYEAMAWRLRIEGSKGQAKLEFNGPVPGFQTVYREGLAALDEAAGNRSFADVPGLGRDLILRSSDDPRIAELVDVAFLHTVELMYGAPEYGANRDLLGWEYTNYDGDVQPRGYTREQIEQLDPAGAREPSLEREPSTPMETLVAMAPLGFGEAAHGILAPAGGSLSALRSALAPIIERAEQRGRDGS